MNTPTTLISFGWQHHPLGGPELVDANWRLGGVRLNPTIDDLGTGQWAWLEALAGIALRAFTQRLRTKS